MNATKLSSPSLAVASVVYVDGGGGGVVAITVCYKRSKTCSYNSHLKVTFYYIFSPYMTA